MNEERGQSTRKLTANIKAAGCAAKIGSAELARALKSIPKSTVQELICGIDNFEDAAVYKITEDIAIVQTIDFFPAVVDDPYLFGRIAAANALSDVYAMGGKPIIALNVLCFPTCDYPIEVVEDILRGGADAVKEAGAVVAGGHSIQLGEPVYGLSVTGIVNPKKVLTNGGARNGDAIILTKPLGIGISLMGLKADMLSETARRQLFDTMTALNDRALRISSQFEVHAATDVTGFGLAGHVHEMARASGLSAYLYIGRLPLLKEARELARQGLVPAGSYGNRKSFEANLSGLSEIDLDLSDIIFDPQTSGGLLFAVKESDAEHMVTALEKSGLTGSRIGMFNEGPHGLVEVNL